MRQAEESNRKERKMRYLMRLSGDKVKMRLSSTARRWGKGKDFILVNTQSMEGYGAHDIQFPCIMCQLLTPPFYVGTAAPPVLSFVHTLMWQLYASTSVYTPRLIQPPSHHSFIPVLSFVHTLMWRHVCEHLYASMPPCLHFCLHSPPHLLHMRSLHGAILRQSLLTLITLCLPQ